MCSVFFSINLNHKKYPLNQKGTRGGRKIICNNNSTIHYKFSLNTILLYKKTSFVSMDNNQLSYNA